MLIILLFHLTLTSLLLSAQECRNFLLYYVPATLSGILPDKYLVLLAKSVRIRLGMHITRSDHEVAKQFIELYVMLYEEYYGMPIF